MLSRSIARDKYQGARLTQFFALLMTVNGIAPVVSPVIGGYIITAFDWRILFWTMAGIGGVLLLLSLTVLRETLPGKDPATTHQQSDIPVLKNRPFMRYCLIQAFMMAGLFSYIGSSSFVIQSEYGMTALQFSLLFGVNGIGLIIAAQIFSRLSRRYSADTLLRGGLSLAVLCAVITLFLAWQHLPLPALIGLFFTVSFMSGISTVAGSKAMSEVSSTQSGTASALMGTLMFVCGGIAAPLAGLGGETMLKMSLAMTISYLIALLFGLQKTTRPVKRECSNKIFQFCYCITSRPAYKSLIIR